MAEVVRWAVVALSAATAGYMVVDGVRAFVRGDYITPRSGRYAGRLGPWAGLVSAIGIEPRSTGMKVFFVAYGIAWLAIALAFAVGVPWAWLAMLVAAIGALWYLLVGTIVSVVVIALLFAPGVRDVFA